MSGCRVPVIMFQSTRQRGARMYKKTLGCGLINGQSPSALLAAVGQNLAAIRRAHPGAKPMLALPFFNGWMIGAIHKFFPDD